MVIDTRLLGPLLESDMWFTELTFIDLQVHFELFLSENKCSLLLQSLV